MTLLSATQRMYRACHCMSIRCLALAGGLFAVMISVMPPRQPPVSIITPTFREAANLRSLAQRVFAALDAAKIEAELLIIDDNSQDGTEEVAGELAKEYPVRLIVRRDQRGLSSAVITGFSHARFDRFLVLDADLQHPPEAIPDMLKRLEADNCDFVIGTRYGAGGEVVQDWPAIRRLVSWTAGLLARPLTPLSDPMAGFFALRRSTWQRAKRLNPIGYKIALELYVKCRCRRPGEIAITFQTRAAGESKLTATQQVRYLRQLVGLYHFRFPWLFPVVLVVLLVLAGWSLLF